MPENKNIPALRFPGFTDPWEKKTLDDISSAAMYGMNSASKQFDGANKYLRITDIDNISRQLLTSTLTSPDGILEEKYLLKEGDIVFTRTGASVGKTYFYKKNDGRVYFAGFLIKFHIDKSKVNPYFVFLNTLRINYGKWVVKMSMRSGQPGINAEEYKSFKIYLPCLAEQQKIASFLSAIEERLQQLQQQHNLLEQYKKGCMEQIFSGQVRFKDKNGREYPEWEEKALSDCYISIPTNSFSRDDLNYDSGEIKNIHYGDIHTQFLSLFNASKERVPFLNYEITGGKDFSNILCKEGDLVLADASEDTTDVGKCIELINLNNEKIVAGLHTILLRPDLSKIIVGFGGYLLNSPAIKTQIARISQGSKVYSISSRRLLDLRVKIPSCVEQTKIFGFLSAIDTYIGLTKTQLNLTQKFKRGLLKQMFV